MVIYIFYNRMLGYDVKCWFAYFDVIMNDNFNMIISGNFGCKQAVKCWKIKPLYVQWFEIISSLCGAGIAYLNVTWLYGWFDYW